MAELQSERDKLRTEWLRDKDSIAKATDIIKILIIEWKIISTCLSCPKFSIGHPVLVLKPSGFPLNTLRE
jgi:hypothetical protein